VYFLILMADGRKLQEKLQAATSPSVVVDMHEDEIPLIDPDYPLWMAHPFGEDGTAGGDEAPLGLSKTGPPGADRIFG
jgi:hypothetical protein